MREYLKELRIKNGFTQKYVAEKIGISQNYYSCIENGSKQKNIKLQVLVSVANLYGVDVNSLIEEERVSHEKEN